MSGENANTLWARTFVRELAAAGVRRACIAPGSRSTPLVMALAEDERFERIVHLDERSAGFFALGVGRAGAVPAVVVTTSGTAAANLFPAVIEAYQAEVPLLVVTADRPARLRGTDANQTIDQVSLYGSHVKAFHEVPAPSDDGAALRHLRALAGRAVGVATGTPAGPVHLNFPFAKPLEPMGGVRVADDADGERPAVRVVVGAPSASAEVIEAVSDLIAGSAQGLIVLGPTAAAGATPEAAARLSEATGFPLLADPLSGARFGPEARRVLGTYDVFLRDPRVRDRMRPDLVLRVGATPTSVALQALLEESAGVPQVVVDPGGRWKDHLAVATDYVRAEPAAFLSSLCDRVTDTRSFEGWRASWARAEEVARAEIERWRVKKLCEGSALAAVVESLASGTNLFVSNSMPVRDLDAFAPSLQAAIHVYGNRGASGIDGIVSSALGVAAGSGRKTVAILGDIALCHDMNGLLAGAKYAIDCVFVVIHNDGGGIFQALPIREHEPEFTTYFRTPHGIDLADVARVYGITHRRVERREDLLAALSAGLATQGPALIEVPADAEASHRRRQEAVDAVTEAVNQELSKGALA